MNLLDLSSPITPPRREVSVRVGGARGSATPVPSAGLCVVGLVPTSWPWLAELAPRALVRDTRFRGERCAIEHLRLTPRDSVEVLPGLVEAGSLLRDAVTVGLCAGAPVVDVVVARMSGLQPWELDEPDVADAMDHILDDLPGAVVVIPDLAGPPIPAPISKPPLEPHERLDVMRASASRLFTHLSDRFQIALVDLPAQLAGELPAVLASIPSADAAVCGWSGSPNVMAAQGWRSAAAALGAALVCDRTSSGTSLVGRPISLPPPRRVAQDRRALLATSDAWGPAHVDGGPDRVVARVTLDDSGLAGRVSVEGALRHPPGQWTLPALRTVKSIHRRVVETASRFVFDRVDEGRAAAFGVAIRHALEPFTERGMLVGPDLSGPPQIHGWPDRDPAAPALAADLIGWLRPWSITLGVRVVVRPGLPAVLEVM